jgi:hypothetical protein|tara:strand:- start:16558 stop:17127 length:570 start_codon:yes stop_codon:yes gene_type:complete
MYNTISYTKKLTYKSIDSQFLETIREKAKNHNNSTGTVVGDGLFKSKFTIFGKDNAIKVDRSDFARYLNLLKPISNFINNNNLEMRTLGVLSLQPNVEGVSRPLTYALGGRAATDITIPLYDYARTQTWATLLDSKQNEIVKVNCAQTSIIPNTYHYRVTNTMNYSLDFIRITVMGSYDEVMSSGIFDD